MIYIIIKNDLIHSVWDNKEDAEYQKTVLIDHGFDKNRIDIEEIEGTIPINGRYYL